MRAKPRKDSLNDLTLTSQEKDFMREKFYTIDKNGSGAISQGELSQLFEEVGETLTDDKMREVLEMLEERGIKKIDETGALRAWNFLKEINQKEEEEEMDLDILNAFVAMGGNLDGSGVIKKKTLENIIKVQFDLTVRLDEMYEQAGLDISSDDLNFYEFTCLLESGGPQRDSRLYSLFSLYSHAN